MGGGRCTGSLAPPGERPSNGSNIICIFLHVYYCVYLCMPVYTIIPVYACIIIPMYHMYTCVYHVYAHVYTCLCIPVYACVDQYYVCLSVADLRFARYVQDCARIVQEKGHIACMCQASLACKILACSFLLGVHTCVCLCRP